MKGMIRTGHRGVAACGLLFLVGAGVQGQTIYVDTINDSVDFGGAQTVADLPGPGGLTTFREAVIAANNTPGPQTIGFHIPMADITTTSGMATIRVGSSPFNLNDDGTVIDGRTQTEFAGDTNPGGNEVGFMNVHPAYLGSYFIFVNSNDNVLREIGFMYNRGYGISLQGDRNVVTGCVINGPLYAAVHVEGNDNVVGGTNPEDANVLSSGNEGVRIEGTASGNRVIGNILDSAVSGVLIREQATGNIIGGYEPGEANVLAGSGHPGEEGVPVGSQIVILSSGNSVIGNYIGVDRNGQPTYTNVGNVGVTIRGASDTLVDGNVIGNLPRRVDQHGGIHSGLGISVSDTNTVGNVFVNNLIGINQFGEPIPVEGLGMLLSSFTAGAVPSDTTIGQQGAGNTIAFNDGQGIYVVNGVSGTTISGNSIFENAGLGISFVGVTTSEPVISSATTSGMSVSADGTIADVPNQEFVIEFFASPACDPSGAGEGEVFLGSTSVTTSGAGSASFSVSLAGDVPAGWVLTATSTDVSAGETSEFSACVTLEEGAAGLMGDMDADGDVDLVDFAQFQLCFTGPGGAVSQGACTVTDFDDDGDCDLVDFNSFQLAFTGAL